MKHGKKYSDAAKLVDRSVQYEHAEAISIVKKTATAKFDETVELHIRTGCDGRHADQQIRGAVVLPNGTGKTVRVLVFAKGTKLDEAQAAGADFVGGEELIPKIQKASGVPNKNKVASITKAQVKEIAEIKMPDLNAASIEAAMSMIEGTARSMGVTIKD